jgi:alpha-galactosidase
VAGVVDGVLAASPGIRYLKWDANRDISEPGSAALPADRQSNLWVDTVRARWAVMAEVARRWPDIELMLCASGGGRTDLGTLRWFHEVWLSDNTDAVARLAMQWEASRFLPVQAIAAHVTRWGGQDLAFACAVAMSARFGFDLDPATLSEHERAICRRAAGLYREIRDLVQQGELFRLIAPAGDGGRAALAYAEDGGRRCVVFGYQLSAAGPGEPPCPVAGISSGLSYHVRRVSLPGPEESLGIASGRELLASGLDWPLSRPRTAVLWLLDAAPR